MKLATTTGDFTAFVKDNLEAIELVKNSGFKYIDYSFIGDYANGTGVFSNDWETYIDKLKEHIKTLGVGLVQSHAPMGAPIKKWEGYEPFIEANKRCIEACGRLGIKNIVIHSGYEKDISVEECFERNKKFYIPLLECGEKHGVSILTENFNKMFMSDVFWVDNATDMLSLIEYVDHPMFHCCWDTGHGNLQEYPQHEEIMKLGSHVKAVHIQDNYGDDDWHMAPFGGTLNLDSVMHGLKGIDYKGYFTFEACSNIRHSGRRPFEADSRLAIAPLKLKIMAEELLYETGKYILEAYDCFEE